MADTITTHYSLTQPQNAGSQNTWGIKINSDLATLDSIIWSASMGTTIGVNAPGASGTNITLTNPLNNIQNISFSAGSLALILPVMNTTASMVVGGKITINNVGSNAFEIFAQDGSTVILSSLATGQSATLTLLTNATANGTFTVIVPIISGGPATFSTLHATGAATFDTTMAVTGNFAINTSEFMVDATTGNTVAAGTLTGKSFTPTNSTVPANGVYLPSANSPGISANSNLIASFGSNGSANYLSLQSNATGSGPIIAAFGSDTNIILQLSGKGTGGIKIQGTSTNDNVQTGYVGEYISSTVLSGSAVSLTNSSDQTITSISLTAGDWDVWGQISFSAAVSTVVTSVFSSISTTNNLNAIAPGGGSYYFSGPISMTGNAPYVPIGLTRMSISGTTTIYLIVTAVFSTSTLSAFGFIGARRVR